MSHATLIGRGIGLLLVAASVSAQTVHDHHPTALGATMSEATQTTPTMESAHVPPDPPVHPMEPMSDAQMLAVMQMDDTAHFGVIRVDQFEWHPAAAILAWDAQAWYGGDYDKLRLRTEGERSDGATEAASAEALWEHTAFRWWSVLGGVRYDFGDGPTRTWAAFGIEGLAPQWLDVETTFYVGEQGRTALRAHLRYDLLLTQRLILQPQLEANLYGKDDSARGIGSGLSDIEAGLRVRYELRREFAPYVGVEWRGLFGNTADLARSAGRDSGDTQFVVGLHLWF